MPKARPRPRPRILTAEMHHDGSRALSMRAPSDSLWPCPACGSFYQSTQATAARRDSLMHDLHPTPRRPPSPELQVRSECFFFLLSYRLFIFLRRSEAASKACSSTPPLISQGLPAVRRLGRRLFICGRQKAPAAALAQSIMNPIAR